jgi:2-dehydro-3-deoxyphosphooctonate aldolase (KDO 8-P synthase)
LTTEIYKARPLIIAGPCVAESYELLETVVEPLKKLSDEIGFNLVFKASFDKANRSSIDSYRGPGMQTALQWMADIHSKYQVETLTDVHETAQVKAVAEACQWLQIPAFLCRQTDLIVACTETGRKLNVKKGQFLAPELTREIVKKVRSVVEKKGTPFRLALTERGSFFGYDNYVVDMRGIKTMAETGAHVIYDVTHSVQRPGGGGSVSGGNRSMAPLLARSAAATGYLDGFFMEVHPNPRKAASDGATILSIEQATTLLKQIIPLWRDSMSFPETDRQFTDRDHLG